MRFIPRSQPTDKVVKPLPQLTPVTGKRGPGFKIEGSFKAGTVYESGISICKQDGQTFVAAATGILDTPKLNNPQWVIVAEKGRDAPAIPTEAWHSYLEDLAVKEARRMHSELEERQQLFAAKSLEAYFSEDLQMGTA